MMKLFNGIALAALTIMGSAVLSAAPTCSNQDIAAYISLGTGGCTIGNLLFSSFALQVNGNTVTNTGDATTIFLNPITSGGDGIDITNTGTDWSQTATRVWDDDITYLVTVLSGPQISTMYLSETGSAGAPTSGNVGGLDTITEQLCAAGTLPVGSCSGVISNSPGLQINGDPTAQNNVTVNQTLNYTLTSSLSVDKDIQIGAPGGTSTGASSLTDVKNIIGAVPEPSTYAFLLIACGALIGFKKYRQGKSEA